MERFVVTLVGKDTVGIIAKVCTFFARNGMNILDISQTTMRDVISMTVIVDSGGMPAETAREGIASLASDVRCIIHLEEDSALEDLARRDA